MKKLLFITVFVLASLCSFAQGVKFLEGEKWSKVLEMAKEQNKLIFMDCYTSWCGPCKSLAQDVFPQKEVGDFFNANFINVKYDMEKGEGKELHTRYKKNIVGFPTLLLINKDGEIVHQMAGFHAPAELIAGIKSGLEGKTLPVMKEKYDAGNRDLDFLREYVKVLQGAFLKDEIQRILVDYMKSLPVEELLNKEVWDLVGEYVKDPYSPQFYFVVFNFDKYVYKIKADGYRLERQLAWAIEKEMDKIVNQQRDTAGNILPLVSDPKKEELLLTMINRVNFKRAEEMRAKFKIHNLKLAEEWKKVMDYILICRDIKALGYSDSYVNETMRYLADNCKDKKVLRQALVLMEKIQAQEDQSKGSKSNYHDTLASLYRVLGDKKKAVEHQAIYDEIVEKARAEFQKAWDNM